MSHHSLSRRELLWRSGLGLGSMALASLVRDDFLRGASGSPAPAKQPIPGDLMPRPGHFPGPARAVIQLYQEGGPSQVDLFDPKPELTKRNGQHHPDGVKGPSATNKDILKASPFKFQRHGQCGMELSDIIPHLAGLADDLCLVRSMHTDVTNHPEAISLMLTGKIFPGRPTIGAWVSYALGTENQNLPAFIALRDPRGYGAHGKSLWQSGWLPALYQGVEFSSRGKPVQHLTPEQPIPPATQRDNLRLLAELNAGHLRDYPGDSELETRIKNYELAARMQLAAMAALDLSRETAATRRLYGLDNPLTADYGTRCLMARRLIEAGVRFVQVLPPLDRAIAWDHHQGLTDGLRHICDETDRPAAALIHDLKSRGLLDSTLVMWGGEFGRLPTTENSDGRDHNKHGFSICLAGGGFKGGYIHGATDDFGYKAVVDRVSVPDLQATVLHQLGIDHRILWYPHHGRRETLTDAAVTGAKVVKELLQG